MSSNTRDWYDEDISSATNPDAVLRQERLELANYDARMRLARSKAQAPGAPSMRVMMREKKSRDQAKQKLKP